MKLLHGYKDRRQFKPARARGFFVYLLLTAAMYVALLRLVACGWTK